MKHGSERENEAIGARGNCASLRGVLGAGTSAAWLGACWLEWLFSLTPALSRWERENRRPRPAKRCGPANRSGCNNTEVGQTYTLSQRERAGVRACLKMRWSAAVSQTSRSHQLHPDAAPMRLCCGWSRTTQPRSGIFSQALRENARKFSSARETIPTAPIRVLPALPGNSKNSLLPALAFLLLLVLARTGAAAERFEDIVIAAQSTAAGESTHGYFEHRFLIENQSATRSHTVELVLPERAGSGWGDSISSIRRAATVGPGSTVTLSLWQPALPIHSGNNVVRVNIGGRPRGVVLLPHAVRHATTGTSSGSPAPPVALVSRSLNTDDLEAALAGTTHRPAKPYSAEMAVGPPDVPGTAIHPNAWMPEPNGRPHWLELDFPPVTTPKSITIYETFCTGLINDIVLYDAKHEQLATVSNTVASVARGNHTHSFSLRPVSNAVATVRINFRPSAERKYAIDSVRLNAASGSEYAIAARADSSGDASHFGSSSPPKSATTPSPLKLLRAETEPAAWSEHWLAYTRFDAVILHDADFAALSAGAREALLRYAEAGGTIAVFGKTTPPATALAFEKESSTNVRRFHVGFGLWLALEASDTKSLNVQQRRKLLDAASHSQGPWRSEHDSASANAAWPVVEDHGLPLRGLVAILLVFVILIGPVNVFVLSRRNRRIWLLWTIPAISGVTCLLVFGYSFVSEGFTPSVRLEGVTLLDQINHRATTLGRTAFYAPLTPGNGLHFSFDTEVTPFVSKASGNTAGREIVLNQDQNLASGWVTARVPAHFLLRKSETRRERIDVEFAADGTPTVVNGLGGEIRSLRLAGLDGSLWQGEKLAAGQKARLTNSGGRVSTATESFSAFYNSDWAANLNLTVPAPERFLRPGTYRAELDSAPFLENGLGAKAPLRAKSQVFGIFQAPPAAP